jgi:uncharacterized protein YodC (DUF2158 family)
VNGGLSARVGMATYFGKNFGVFATSAIASPALSSHKIRSILARLAQHMAAEFKPGDIVQLKSGGPAMTVASDLTNGGHYCEWFKGASKERAHFNEETLQPYVAPKKA